MPVLLLIDTCGATGYVAAVDTDGPVPLLAAQTLPARETQERLMTAIAAVLTEAALTLAGLAVIAVVTGPGSFTGVRIGLAATKGLAEAGNLPIVALSRLAVLAAASGKTGRVIAWLDAGRTDLYAGTFDLEPSRSPHATGEVMLPRAAAVQALGEGTLVVENRDLAPPAAQACCVTEEEIRHAASTLAAASFHAGSFANIALLDANYLRVLDAELALRARLTATV